ncbi:SGNH/GDSL hydrolase family protein [Luedemannella helvata]|uniref:SGNH/GDSL hydrolase family protein n=1 Tax=Luedemannella helvata TaxID=349315 RepID=UPI0031DE8AB6
MTITIPPGATVLFIGDSITDAGRDRANPHDLGHGYALIAAARFSARHPRLGVRFVNRGIGGDRVRDLRERWTEDCLDVNPAVVSVMIGINDTWRRFDSGEVTSIEDYERDYRAVLTAAREVRTASFVLIEPFLLPVTDAQHAWRADLDPRIAVTRRLAADFGAALVPADGLFARAAADVGPYPWTTDGVHLTPAGDALLAEEWLHAISPPA